MEQEPEKSRQELAEAYFRKGFNCAQSVFLAFAKDYGFDENTALRLSASFGGGIGRMREVCGCFLAMSMIAGLETGSTKENDPLGKQQNYETVQRLAKEYRKISGGSILCRELLGLNQDGKRREAQEQSRADLVEGAKPAERTEEYYKKRPCIRLIKDACTIIENEFFGGTKNEQSTDDGACNG